MKQQSPAPPKRKRGRPKLTPEQRRAREVDKARVRLSKALSAHLPEAQAQLWDDMALAGEFDVAMLWRLTMMELAQMTRDYAKGLEKGVAEPDRYRRRKAEYLELARRLAVAAKDIDSEPISELTINHQGLTVGGIWLDDAGRFIPPKKNDNE